jgi:eukaryotic-like serine/threonine-protein kinase
VLLAERYRLTETLGHGGMGEVFRGCDELLGRPVAVKLLLPDRGDPFAATRFRREARTAAMVKDQHVVAAYDFGHDDGNYYLVMELVEGRSVAHELAMHGPFEPERALAVIRQTAAGLAAAHRHDIVHRDIKPSNLLIDADGTVKIADFGIARFVDDTAITAATEQRVLGTSHYLAPERAVGKPATAASDVYALGCVLYQLVTGHPPFMGDDPTTVLSQHVNADPIPPSEVRPELAGPLEDLILRMLAKDPGQRPSADELADVTVPDLAAVELEPVYDSQAWQRVLSGAGAPTTQVLDRSPTRRHWRRVFAVAGAVLLTGCLVAAGVLKDDNSVKPSPTTEVTPSRPAPTPTPRPSSAPKHTPTATITKTVPAPTASVRPSDRSGSDGLSGNEGKGRQKAKKSPGKG